MDHLGEMEWEVDGRFGDIKIDTKMGREYRSIALVSRLHTHPWCLCSSFSLNAKILKIAILMPLSIILNLARTGITGHACNRITRKMPMMSRNRNLRI